MILRSFNNNVASCKSFSIRLISLFNSSKSILHVVLIFVTKVAIGFMSIPIQGAPYNFVVTVVVPLPQNGSRTILS